MSTTNSLQMKIFTPFETYFEGEAQSLSATNDTGKFDILYNHANFICLLLPGEIRIDTRLGEKSFTIQKGILKVHNNAVVVFVNV